MWKYIRNIWGASIGAFRTNSLYFFAYERHIWWRKKRASGNKQSRIHKIYYRPIAFFSCFTIHLSSFNWNFALKFIKNTHSLLIRKLELYKQTHHAHGINWIAEKQDLHKKLNCYHSNRSFRVYIYKKIRHFLRSSFAL